MELPDFTFDPQFERLRELMGADKIVELDEEDWEDWDGFGIDIGDISEVEVDPDGSFTYRGRKVLVYIRDQFVRQDDELSNYRYHVAECRTLTKMKEENRNQRYVVTTRTDSHFVVNLFRMGQDEPFKKNCTRRIEVCKNCLTALDWRGYTMLGGSKKKACWRNFDPREFLDRYGSKVKGLPTNTPETAPLAQYPKNRIEISKRVRERSEWTCQRCAVVLKDPHTRHWLNVHHRDGDKTNSSSSNLEALCIRCHAEEFQHEHLRDKPDYQAFLRWLKASSGRPTD